MANVSYKLKDLEKCTIKIGYVGENEDMHVLIDCKEVFKEYPNAVATMAIVPPEGEGYPKTVTRDGDVVEWLVTNSDVTVEGDGEFQLTFTEGEVIKKSTNGRFRVIRSISGSGEAPSGIQDWLTDANEKLAEVEQATQDAEAAASHQPYIGIDGYWYTWNGEEFVKNVKAQGEKGDPGDPGSPGDPTQLIDDTDPAADKVFSSSKIDEMNTQLLNAIHQQEGCGKLLSNPIKAALINLFDHVAYTDGNGQSYIQALKEAWKVTGTLVSISADFEQGSAVIDVNADLNTLRQYLTVTGTFTYEGSTFEEEVIDYTLSGTLESGENTITVTYKDKTTTFTVYIESLIPAEYQQVEYVGATAQDQYILFDDIQPATDVEAAKYAFEIEFQFDEWNSAANTNIVAGFTSSAGLWIGYNNQVGNIAMGTASGCYFTDNNPTAKHKYSYVFDTISGSYGKGKFTRDDNAVIERQATSQNFASHIFCLFSAVDQNSGSGRNSNFDFKGKIYSFSMTYEGDPLLNLIPCYRKSDNVIGFYDTVEGTFYTNSGSGNFTKGGNV